MTIVRGFNPAPAGSHSTVSAADFIVRHTARTRIFGLDIDPVGQQEAVSRILSWCDGGDRQIVVTPNVDHVIALEGNAALRSVYSRAGLILADGMPFIWASRLVGAALRERVAGSDLIVPLCRAAAASGRSVFLLGTSFEVLTEASRNLVRSAPGLTIAGVYSPPRCSAMDEREDAVAVDMINSVRPDIVLVAMGMPKQELWAGRNVSRLDTHAILCIGAGLDYIAGSVRRAPLSMRRFGLEWLWRALSEPKRLGPRYLRNLACFPRLVMTHLRDRRQHAD